MRIRCSRVGSFNWDPVRKTAYATVEVDLPPNIKELPEDHSPAELDVWQHHVRSYATDRSGYFSVDVTGFSLTPFRYRSEETQEPFEAYDLSVHLPDGTPISMLLHRQYADQVNKVLTLSRPKPIEAKTRWDHLLEDKG